MHIATLGTGVVREVRNGRRYLVELKGHSVVVAEAQLEAAAAPRGSRGRQQAAPVTQTSPALSVTLDLHGATAAVAVEWLDSFLNQALLDGASEARIIHGRSGGALKAAVHARLKEYPSLQGYGLDPRNPGVTVVRF